jgi:dolichol-phosphate mannosyltransferase
VPPTSASRTLILIATYNERENLPTLLESVFHHVDADVLLVDDGSPDGTGEIADSMARTEPRLHVVHREGKQGVASAHVLGFRYALENGYDAMVEMDADFSHPPEDLPRLLEASRRADVVLGSRTVPGGAILGRSRTRNLLTHLGCAYARTVLNLGVRDCTGGFRCSRRAALELIDWSRVRSEGYGFQLELNRAWTLAGARFEEIPIRFPDRRAGRSKMTTAILVESLLVVLRLRFHLIPSALKSQVRLATPAH